MKKAAIKGKNEYWQCIRGLCILAVVMIHAPAAVDYELWSGEFTAWLLIRQIINFTVATFIFLSGFFTNPDKCTLNYGDYLKKRFVRLLIPYLLYSFLYSAFTVLRTVHLGQSIDWKGIIYNFIVGKSATPLYYILVLLQLCLITPLLIKIIRKKNFWSKALWFVTPVYLAALYVWNFYKGTPPRLYETLFPAWFLFYYLGLHTKLNKDYWEKVVSKAGKLAFVILAMLLSMGESVLLIFAGCKSTFAVSQIKISSFIFSFCVIMYVCRLQKRHSNNVKSFTGKFLKLFGDNSYGIYYIHYFFVIIIKSIFSSLGIEKIWIIYFILTWLAVSAVSVFIVWLANCLLSKSQKGEKILRLIGFK